jgi:hypothetical protein
MGHPKTPRITRLIDGFPFIIEPGEFVVETCPDTDHARHDIIATRAVALDVHETMGYRPHSHPHISSP